ncbi:MAG: Heat shock protein GrpE [uncultured Sulfurovum sp.]|uniref:Protein GrpE n=1 Tax=uncultured Sulfurovum sp. TaxID=269237 RepID=A0A6S6SHJ2_9BACT|nr:MAG: Heat shock protein GrpE [uncultured Sulfurovum sp.]
MSDENKTTEESQTEEVQTEDTIEEQAKATDEGSTEVDPLEEALAEAADYKDKYLRAHADFENTKRRLEKDKNNAVSYANESFAKDILAVMDSFENALSSIENADDENNSEVLVNMKEGVNLTFEQLKKILEKNSIKEVDCSGEFDPEVHQAIMQVESDEHEVGDVVQVMQKGYTIKDRVLRPAMVSTCK